VAVLDRTRAQPRKFSRIRPARITELLGARGPAVAAPTEPGPGDADSGEADSSESADGRAAGS
jgi:proteasome alpha subunit